MAGAGAGTPQVFTHVSYGKPLSGIADRIRSGGRPVVQDGKPAGFWLAPDLSWIDLISSRKSWEIAGEIVKETRPEHRFEFTKDYYDDVFRGKPAEDYTPGTPLRDVGATSPSGGFTHFVYQFSVDMSRATDNLDDPDLTRIFRMTPSNMDEFLRRAMAWYEEEAQKNDPLLGRLTETLAKLGFYHQRFMATRWGGIFFDSALYTPELEEAHRWIKNTEIPTLCLWHPIGVLGLKTKTDPATGAVVGDPSPNLAAVLTIVGTKKQFGQRIQGKDSTKSGPLRPYASPGDKLYVAGIATDRPRLVMIMRKGKFVPTAIDREKKELLLTGGVRGRTFRRTFRRRDKNGRRPTRKSKHRRNK